MTQTVHQGRWTPDDRAERFYREIPVDVPPGCSGLAVELEYDGSAGVLDLGCAGPAGFRGWSGGARSRFVITPMAATPGYLPGELEPGTWHVWLGLHRVDSEGVRWRLRADTEGVRPDPAPVPTRRTGPPTGGRDNRRSRRKLPAPPDQRWLAGDLHAHTVHSDGSLTVDELATLAADRGLDFLAVTDHNTTSHHAELAGAGGRAAITLLPGQEVTTDRGHANAFGERIGWVDFRQPPDTWVDQAARAGDLLSINHPLAGDCAWRWPLTNRPPLAEIWHWTWLDRSWGGPLAWWTAWDLATIPVGGSDLHKPDDGPSLGAPTTWVCCTGETPEEILEGLASGRTAVSADPDGPVLLRTGDELVAVEGDGLVLNDPTGRRRVVRGERATFPVDSGSPVGGAFPVDGTPNGVPGPFWLEDQRNRVHALCR